MSPLQTETVCRVSWVALMVDHHCTGAQGHAGAHVCACGATRGAVDMIATHADMVYLDATHARCRHCGTIVCAFATFEMQPLAQRHLAETHGEDAS